MQRVSAGPSVGLRVLVTCFAQIIVRACIAMITFAYFSGFDAPLKRTEADESGESSEESVLDVGAVRDEVESDTVDIEAIKA